jgi:hypothetical protein
VQFVPQQLQQQLPQPWQFQQPSQFQQPFAHGSAFPGAGPWGAGPQPFGVQPSHVM